MENRKKSTTLAAVIGGIALVLILVLGTIWVGRSAKTDTEAAARSVSLLYMDELADRRERVVAENLQDKISVINAALRLMDEERLVTLADLQRYQARMKTLFALEKFAFVDEDGLIYTVEGNSGDRCVENRYYLSSAPVYGFGLPLY